MGPVEERLFCLLGTSALLRIWAGTPFLHYPSPATGFVYLLTHLTFGTVFSRVATLTSVIVK